MLIWYLKSFSSLILFSFQIISSPQIRTTTKTWSDQCILFILFYHVFVAFFIIKKIVFAFPHWFLITDILQ